MTTTTCECGAPVIEAVTSSGPVRLQNRPYARGPVAASQGGGGLWFARLLPPGASLAPNERRYSLHDPRCPGRGGGKAAWEKALNAARHKERATRGRRPRVKPVAGVRKAGER